MHLDARQATIGVVSVVDLLHQRGGVAARLNGVLCLNNAALYHGWEVKRVPRTPHVLVLKWRSIPSAPLAHVHWGNLRADQIDGMATSCETTLMHCLRSLSFDEALAIADSALRHGVARGVLDGIADSARGPGCPQCARADGVPHWW